MVTHKMHPDSSIKLKRLCQIVIEDRGRSSPPTITHVEGLTPIEQRDAADGGAKRKKKKQPTTPLTASAATTVKETPAPGTQDTATSPNPDMAASGNARMYEIDLGEGGNEITTEAEAPANKQQSSKDQGNGKARDDEVQVQLKPGGTTTSGSGGKGVPDSDSLYSLYMESDFRYYLQHPYARLFLAYFVTLCNFLIYAEDPVAHSRFECNIPVIGNCFAFVGTRYPPNAWSLLKVVLWLGGTLVGLVVGKLLFHKLILNRLLRLKMFTEDRGSWMTMFLCTIVCVFIFSYIYNLFLMIGGDSTSDYRISPYMSISNNIFMKAAATGTWCGDFFTAWMVTDIMLQERLYPGWARRVRVWWNTRYNRIILFWVVVLVSSFIVIFVIATDYINWDRLNRDFLHSNELSRAFLASFILVMDITIVMQDWDFPHFLNPIDIKLPGVNTAHIHFKIPRLLKKLEYWHVHITGKWFSYGVLFIVIILDFNMWKNQIFYEPAAYGQYVDSKGRIHSVRDPYSLENFNETQLTFDFRNSTLDPVSGKRFIELDTVMNARYNEYDDGLKALAFVPSVTIFVLFLVLVITYGRLPEPTKDDPYSGRLKKRRRHLFRFGPKHYRKRFHTTAMAVEVFQAAIKESKLWRELKSKGYRLETDRDLELRMVQRWKQTKGKKESPSANIAAVAEEPTGTTSCQTGASGGPDSLVVTTLPSQFDGPGSIPVQEGFSPGVNISADSTLPKSPLDETVV